MVLTDETKMRTKNVTKSTAGEAYDGIEKGNIHVSVSYFQGGGPEAILVQYLRAAILRTKLSSTEQH
jgi:hypothetical protein